MTLGELKQQIDWYYKEFGDRLDDIEVCIPNNKVGIGGTSVTYVQSAHKGFDWDSGRFIIYPKVPMVEQQTSTQ